MPCWPFVPKEIRTHGGSLFYRSIFWRKEPCRGLHYLPNASKWKMGGKYLGKTGQENITLNSIPIMISKGGVCNLESIDFNSHFNKMRKKVVVSRGENKVLCFYQTGHFEFAYPFLPSPSVSTPKRRKRILV